MQVHLLSHSYVTQCQDLGGTNQESDRGTAAPWSIWARRDTSPSEGTPTGARAASRNGGRMGQQILSRAKDVEEKALPSKVQGAQSLAHSSWGCRKQCLCVTTQMDTTLKVLGWRETTCAQNWKLGHSVGNKSCIPSLRTSFPFDHLRSKSIHFPLLILCNLRLRAREWQRNHFWEKTPRLVDGLRSSWPF